MHKFTKIMVSILLVFMTCSYVNAKTDFSSNKDKYMQLCASKKITSKNKTVCKQFNEYLKDENEKLNEETKKSKQDITDTKASLSDIAEQLTSIQGEISSKTKEINYISKTIKNTKAEMKKTQKELGNRMYAMQTYVNSNMYVDYVFSASDFTELISRHAAINDLTYYDHEIIEKYREEKETLDTQKASLELAVASLDVKKKQVAALEKQYTAALEKQYKELALSEGAKEENLDSVETIEKNLAAIANASNASAVTGVTKATPKTVTVTKSETKTETKSETKTETKTETTKDTSSTKKTETSTTDSKKDTSSTKKDTSSDTSTSKETTKEETTTKTETVVDNSNSAALGLKIANKALTKQGCTYVWGACHSLSGIRNADQSTFDCSGLVCWAHYQCGVTGLGATNTKGIYSYGKKISKSDIQPGDVIVFSSGGYSGIHHVGIYIGNNQMVHAPCTGQTVKVADLSGSYWQSQWYATVRCY